MSSPDADRSLADTASFSPSPGPVETLPTLGSVGGKSQETSVEIPGYEILGELGRGGMGVVYRARQIKANRIVALKMILSSAHAGTDELARFQTEAQAIAHLQHPNIVQVYDVGEHEGRPFFSLEFCEGGSLERKLSGTPLQPVEAAQLVETLARAMHAAHQKGIIHRDLKPANVLLTVGSGQWTVGSRIGSDSSLPTAHCPPPTVPKITDFGLAKKLDDVGQTQSGAIVGTPSYMSPEQAAGKSKELGPAADIYALGAILYECLTGRPPFKAATTLDTILQVMNAEPVPPSQLQSKTPRDLETICLKCLQKEPRKRYASAFEFADDLRRFLEGKAILARPVGPIERAVKWVKRNPVVTGATAAVILALAVGGAISYAKYLEAEDARKAETERVRERDDAIEAEKQRVKERDESLGLTNVLLAVSAYDNRDAKLAADRLDRVPPELRRWEWHYLKRQTRGGLFALRGHAQPVSSVAFSPDGARIVTGSLDTTAKVWDARTGAPLLDLKEHTREVTSVAFSPDGARILTGSSDSTAKVWDAKTGARLLDLKGHMGPVSSVAFSPDGARIVTGGHDAMTKVWDAKSGALLLDRLGMKPGGMSVAFSPDGARIVTGSIDRTAQVWNAKSGARLLDLNGHTGGVPSVAFSPDGARIVTGSEDMTARVWDAKTGAALLDLQGHTGSVLSVAFSPDGARIVTGSEDMTARVWDANTGAPPLDLNEPTLGMVFYPDMVFCPDGARLVTRYLRDTGQVWDAKSGAQLLDLKEPTGGVLSVAFSPDGARIVTGGLDSTAKVWDAKTGAWLLNLNGHTDRVASVAFSPDGLRIVTGSYDKTAKVWDAKTGARLLDLEHTDGVGSVVFSPDGLRIVTGSVDKTAKVWDATSGAPLLDLKGHTRSVLCVAFSSDGAQIVTGSDDRTAKVWDAKSGAALHDLKGHTNVVRSVAFSPDGARIVTGSHDGTARVWDYRGGNELWTNGAWDADEFSYRLQRTRPNSQRYREGYEAARHVEDTFAMQFYLDRASSMFPTSHNLRLRYENQRDARLMARASFYLSALAKPEYNSLILHALAANGDRLAKRLVAQEFLRDGKPHLAVPLLFECMLSRPVTNPPVEEFLLASAFLDLNQPDQAKRFYKAAVDWLDEPCKPFRATNIVSHSAVNPWAGVGQMFAPVDDPRRNPFDWENWHECDVFRAEVERRLK